MRTQRFTAHDLVATVLVATATTVFILVRADVDLPLLAHERVLAGTILALGVMACALGSRPDAVTEHGLTPPPVAALRAVGMVVLLAGALAVGTGAEAFTFILLAGTVALWLGATSRHLLTQPPVVAMKAPSLVVEDRSP